MAQQLPRWCTTDAQRALAAEAAEYAALSIAERWERFMALVEWSHTLLQANDRRHQVHEMRDERSEQSLALWRRLMQRRA